MEGVWMVTGYKPEEAAAPAEVEECHKQVVEDQESHVIAATLDN